MHITEKVLEEYGFHSNLHIARDVTEAIAFLQREGIYANAPIPDLLLVLQDAHGADADEVLARIRAVRGMQRIPVVIIVDYDEGGLVLASCNPHHDRSAPGPLDVDPFTTIIRSLGDLWLALLWLSPSRYAMMDNRPAPPPG